MGRVFKALGDMLKGAAKGAADEAFKVGATVMYDTAKAGGSIFRNTLGVNSWKEFVNKPINELGRAYVEETLKKGTIIPFKIKEGFGGLIFTGMAAYGIVSGAASSKDPTANLKAEQVQYMERAQIPNTVSEMLSPRQNKVDNMNADGELVFALHNRRRG